MSRMTAEQLAKELGGKRVSTSGNSYMARCPAHDDRTPSLSITEKHGKILVKCFGGCEQRDVIAALKGLGLWEPEEHKSTKLSFEEYVAQHFVCAYDYTDEAGQLLYQTVRLHSPKDFRPRYWDRNRWVYRKHPCQVLYHLPEVLQSPIVLCPEGEKDVETLRSYGFCATTNAGGSQAPWLPQYTKALYGREVVLLADRDAPGRERVKRVARALLGNVARLLIWEPDEGKDVSDWFAAGHSELELIEAITPQEVAP
jgi:putative DNA primase/helicase